MVTDLLGRLKAKAKESYRRQQIEALYKAFRYWLGRQPTTFDTGQESQPYRRAALDSARAGFKVVVYGHTHLAKKVDLKLGDATYLNTGTWADLMCVPDTILLNDSAEQAKRDLGVFVQDLECKRVNRWTARVPTFAQIEMDQGKTTSAHMYVFGGKSEISEMPNGRLSRLLIKSPAEVAGGGV